MATNIGETVTKFSKTLQQEDYRQLITDQLSFYMHLQNQAKSIIRSILAFFTLFTALFSSEIFNLATKLTDQIMTSFNKQSPPAYVSMAPENVDVVLNTSFVVSIALLGVAALYLVDSVIWAVKVLRHPNLTPFLGLSRESVQTVSRLRAKENYRNEVDYDSCIHTNNISLSIMYQNLTNSYKRIKEMFIIVLIVLFMLSLIYLKDVRYLAAFNLFVLLIPILGLVFVVLDEFLGIQDTRVTRLSESIMDNNLTMVPATLSACTYIVIAPTALVALAIQLPQGEILVNTSVFVIISLLEFGSVFFLAVMMDKKRLRNKRVMNSADDINNLELIER